MCRALLAVSMAVALTSCAVDPPAGQGSAALYLGHASTPPHDDEQTGRISRVLVDTQIFDGWWTSAEVPAGDYWIESSSRSKSRLAVATRTASRTVFSLPRTSVRE